MDMKVDAPVQADVLFTPLTIRNLTLANRIVMSPMTRYFSPDGVPGEDVAAYYRRRAEGGAGLIVTEDILQMMQLKTRAAGIAFDSDEVYSNWAFPTASCQIG